MLSNCKFYYKLWFYKLSLCSQNNYSLYVISSLHKIYIILRKRSERKVHQAAQLLRIICLTNTATRQINQAYIFLGGRRSSTHACKLRLKQQKWSNVLAQGKNMRWPLVWSCPSPLKKPSKQLWFLTSLSVSLSLSLSFTHAHTYIHTHAPHVVWLAVCYFTDLVLIMVFTNSRPEL